jgi:hypothetical protein
MKNDAMLWERTRDQVYRDALKVAEEELRNAPHEAPDLRHRRLAILVQCLKGLLR